MNDIKFEAKNDHAEVQISTGSLRQQEPIALAKFSGIVRLLTATS